MNEYEGYTIGLALMDYLPPLFSGIGLFFLSRIIYQGSNSAGQTAFFGMLLVVAGGACKASWKLFIALGNNYPILDDLLFLLMGPGFVLVAVASLQWAMHASHKAPKLLPVLLGTLTLGAAYWLLENKPNLTFIPTALFTTLLLVGFIIHSAKSKAYFACLLLVVNLGLNLSLQAIARQFSDEASLQWLAQSINAVSQLFFALGFWLLYKHHQKQS